MKRTLSIVAVLVAIAGVPSFAGPQSVVDAVEVMQGAVVGGIDGAGRFLLAVDKNPVDGRVDEYFLFTPRSRGREVVVLEGKATVEVRARQLDIRMLDEEMVVQLILENTAEAKKRVLGRPNMVMLDGLELVRLADESPDAARPTPDIWQSDTWPEVFRDDPLLGLEDLKDSDPPHESDGCGVCPPDGDCTAGGIGSSACSISGCGLEGDKGCSATCSDPDSYSCCKCVFLNASCRCRPCAHE